MTRFRSSAGTAILAFVLALEWVAGAPLQTVVVSKNGSIAGRVLRPDGSPASELRVAAMPVPENESAATGNSTVALAALAMTDSDGRYILAELPPGRYFLVAGPLDELVYFPGVETPRQAQTLAVSSATRLAAGDFRLRAPLGFRVRGRVVREQNNAGEAIQLIDTRRSASLFTDIAPDGSFEFSGVRPGVYTARVTPFETRTFGMQVVVDQDIAGLDIPIPLAWVTDVKVDFTVAVEGGGPLPYFTLLFVPPGQTGTAIQSPTIASYLARPRPAFSARPVNPTASLQFVAGLGQTLSQSQAALQQSQNLQSPRALLPGVLVTAVEKPAFSLRMPLAEYTLEMAAIRLPAGYEVKSIRSGSADLLRDSMKVTAMGVPSVVITLGVSSPPPWVRVEGRVTSLSMLRSRPDRISLGHPELASPLVADIGPDGGFDVPMALPGTYHVVLEPSVDSYRRILTISGGTAVTRVEMRSLPTLLKVSGRITALPRDEKSLIEMALLPQQNYWQDLLSSSPTTIPSDDGSFAFRNVEAGNYQLLLSVCSSAIASLRGLSRFSSESNVFAPPCTRYKAPGVTVTDDDVSVVLDPTDLLSMTPKERTIAGRITVDGKPTPLRISLRISHIDAPDTPVQAGRGVTVQSAPDGSFALTVPDGDYQVTAAGLPFGANLQSLTYGSANLSGKLMRLSSAHQDEILINLTLDRKDFATVSGRVMGVDSSRTPVTLTLKGGELALSIETPVNTNGTFSVSGVPQGKYDLAISGAINRSVADALIIGEIAGNGIHKLEDVAGLEIVFVPESDASASLQRLDPCESTLRASCVQRFPLPEEETDGAR